jgi:prepilin-type N-terminal cleavage/methylation domain-containing protein
MMRPLQKPGFTLIELLVVIAVIAILAAILFPVFAQARDKTRQSACISNCKQIGLGVGMYRQDWDGYGPLCGWPPGARGQFNVHSPTSHYELEWQFTLQPYLKNIAVLRCPGDRRPYEERPISYLYNQLLSFERRPCSEAGMERPAEVVLLWEGYGPVGSATMQDPPLVSGQALPQSMFREYSVWGNHAQWLVDANYGLPRHNEGGHAIYMDLHAKWLRYGQGATQADKVATVERAFPFNTAVKPVPPLPERLPGRPDLIRWVW